MQFLKIIATVFLLLAALEPRAQNFELVENKGQWDRAVKFEAKLTNGLFFLEANGYKVVQHNANDLETLSTSFHNGVQPIGDKTGVTNEGEKLTLRSHAYEVVFNNSNAEVEIIAEAPGAGYNNYFKGSDSKAWAGGCKVYGAATYKNLYVGVDAHYYSTGDKIKYDLIVHPNADLSKLALDYMGVDGLEVRENELVIQTSVGEIIERAPYSYQIINGIKTEVPCHFVVTGKTLSYQLGMYDKSKTVIIDPTLIFSTFTGSTADNWGNVGTYGPGGTMFGAGIVFGTGYPVSNGAFQTTFGGGGNTGEGGGYDMAIIKLSSDGSQRVYATYVGGNGSDIPESIIADAQGNLVVTGRTTSGNFPVTRAKIGSGGGWDIVAFKLNATGNALIGSIQIGGSIDDGVNIQNKYPAPQPISLQQNYGDDNRSEVIFDRDGNILLASCTKSADFPVTAATAFQAVKASQQDALFLKFDANFTTELYGSFLGGNGDDCGYVLATNPLTGEVWMGGGTTSSDFPGNKTGTIGQNAGGNIDGFVALISAGGILQKTTYIATTGNEQVYGLKLDKLGFPYIFGTTTGNFTVQNAPFSQTGGKQFIGKLQKDLSSYVYATLFGTNSTAPNISPTAFFVDNCENVYVAGWGGNVFSPGSGLPPFPTSGTMGLTITSNAIQSTTDGKDFYFFVLEKNATSQLYGSFFGQNGGTADHVDGSSSRFDADGTLYQGICANCGRGATFPTTPGSWATANGNSGCSQALVKIKFNLSGTRSGIKSAIDLRDGDTSGCALPLTVNFRDTVATAPGYEWNFGDSTGIFLTTTPTLSHTFTTGGLYRVSLVAVDNGKCVARDTSFVNIVASAGTNLGADTIVFQNCPGETSNLLLLYNTTGLSALWNTATPATAAPGTYQLIATNNAGCRDTAVAIVKLEVAHWAGTQSSDWHTPANWDINKVPTEKTHVIVSSGTPFLCIISTDNAEAASLQARNGATVQTGNGFSLQIRGKCLTLPPN